MLTLCCSWLRSCCCWCSRPKPEEVGDADLAPCSKDIAGALPRGWPVQVDGGVPEGLGRPRQALVDPNLPGRRQGACARNMAPRTVGSGATLVPCYFPMHDTVSLKAERCHMPSHHLEVD